MSALIELGALIFGICGLLRLARRPRIRVRVPLTRARLPTAPVLIGVLVVGIMLAAYRG